MKYLLDTNVWVDYLNGQYPSVTHRIQRCVPGDLCLTSIVVAELRYGADKSQKKLANHARVDVLTAEIQCLDFDLEVEIQSRHRLASVSPGSSRPAPESRAARGPAGR